jgi:hypothetical protein
MSQRYFRLDLDGTVTDVTLSENKLEVGEDLISNIGGSIVRKCLNVFQIKDHAPTSMVITSEKVCATTIISEIPITAPFIMSGDALVPVFSSDADPVFTMVWKVPGDMILAFMVECFRESNRWYAAHNHLIAFDGEKAAYRIPLSNIYDDGKLCNGEFNSTGKTIQESVSKALDQFCKSQWNQDLDRTPSQSQAMFRFKPTDAGFDQLPPLQKDWRLLCQKIGTESLPLFLF